MRELAQHILDVVENSLEAGAQHLTIEIDENLTEDRLIIRVSDDGRGMDAETMRRAVDPFFTTRTTRRVGLGLSLLKAAAEHCNGRFAISSEPNKGTTVMAEFQHSHVDRAPLGDMPATLMAILLSEHPADVKYVHRVDDRTFAFDSAEIREILGEVPLIYPSVREWLLEYVCQGEAGLWQEDAAGTPDSHAET